MKRHLNMIMATLILVGAFTVSAQAQAASTQRLLANIPFAFNVGKTNLPAGRYTIAVLNPSSDLKILQIRSNDGRSSAMIIATGMAANASDDAKLVFHRYGDQYFFAQAHMGSDRMSLAAIKSSMERAQQHALAVTGRNTVVVIIAE